MGFSEKQREILRFPYRDYDALICDGAVRLLVKWCFPRGQHADGEYRVTRPDTDNLQKLLKDCMTAVGFWRDDAQVSSEIVEKFWAEVPGIYVCMEQINARANCQALVNLGALKDDQT